MLKKDPLLYGETAGQIINLIPQNDYDYLYALIFNNKRDEFCNYIKDYERKLSAS